MLKLLTFWLLALTVCCMEYKIVDTNDTKVTKIKVTSSVIDITKDLFVNVTALKELEMVNVNVKNINENSFDSVPDLTVVVLARNQITHISRRAFAKRNIKSINLSSNKIADIAEFAFEDMEKLDWLDLSNNFLKNINGKWFKNTVIELLDLNNNHITRIYKDAFTALNKLYYLDLSFNQIHFIENGTFSHYSVLTFLDVRANTLTNLNFLSNTQIEELHVSLNKLTYIKLGSTTTVKEIGIYPNPFRCKALEQFWKTARTRGMKIRPAKDNVISWDNKYPVCVSEDAFGDSTDSQERLNDLYFSVVDYTVIGRYAVR